MTILYLELPPELYDRLSQEARVAGDPVEVVAQRLIEEQLDITHSSERERVISVLQSAGLLTKLGPEMNGRALKSAVTLEDVQSALDNSEGKPLSEIIIEMRDPKE